MTELLPHQAPTQPRLVSLPLILVVLPYLAAAVAWIAHQTDVATGPLLFRVALYPFHVALVFSGVLSAAGMYLGALEWRRCRHVSSLIAIGAGLPCMGIYAWAIIRLWPVLMGIWILAHE